MYFISLVNALLELRSRRAAGSRSGFLHSVFHISHFSFTNDLQHKNAELCLQLNDHMGLP